MHLALDRYILELLFQKLALLQLILQFALHLVVLDGEQGGLLGEEVDLGLEEEADAVGFLTGLSSDELEDAGQESVTLGSRGGEEFWEFCQDY